MDTSVKIQAIKAIRKNEVLVRRTDENGRTIGEMGGKLGLVDAKKIVETVETIINPIGAVSLNDVKTALKELMFRSMISEDSRIYMTDLRELYIRYFGS